MIRSMGAILLSLLFAWTTLGGSAMAQESFDLKVDFSQREGIPLIKKFGLFNSGIVTMQQYTRDAGLLDALRVDSLRIDLFMGADNRPFARVADGTAEDMTFHFEELDALVELLAEHGVRPYWSWSYIPYPLQLDGDWRKGPSDLDAWQEMFRTFAQHYRESGLRIAYHEIYNEPDCGDAFFLGTMEDYTQMYIRGAQGIAAGDPDAVIGGPSSAFVDITGDRNLHLFLSGVQQAGVPLDFFSYHSYGCDNRQYIARTRQSRAILSQYVDYDTTELHLNEYNALIQPFQPDGPAEHSLGGASMLTSFQLLLEETDVTLAHWAQFMDTGYEPLGMVDPYGRIKAPYWAYWMYSQMPEQRVQVTGLPPAEQFGLHAMASADDETACILLWNDSDKNSLRAGIHLAQSPFSQGMVEIYTMNDEMDPYWQTEADVKVKPQAVVPAQTCGTELTVELPAGGFVLYRFVKGENQAERAEPIGELLRKRYYFPERGKSNYAFFDETDQTVYLGMGREYSARSIVGTEWERLPSILQINSSFGGRYQEIDLNTSFSVRVDYAVQGVYTRAVLFTFLPMNQRRDATVPWGTGKEPDQVILADTLLTGKTLLMLENYAPEGWDGRGIISFDMHSTGPETWAELSMEAL